MVRLTVYVDVLLFLNTVVDYIIISASAYLTRIEVKLWRKILAAFSAALFSLYIFLPPLGFWFGLLLRLSSSITAVVIAFGFKNPRRFLRCVFVLYAVSFIYAGGMAGIWMLLKPKAMSVNNGIVYFDISPLVLITLSFIFYVVIVIYKKLTGREAETALMVPVNLRFGKRSADATALVDSGHTLSDGFSSSVVIIIDKLTATLLFGEQNVTTLLSLQPPSDTVISKSLRLMPIKTVSGESIMPAVKINCLKVSNGKKTHIIGKPVAVISDTKLSDAYSVVIPPEALNY